MKVLLRLVASLACVLALAACDRGGPGGREGGGGRRLVLAAYSAPRELFERALIPAFEASHRERTGTAVDVEASYLASGAQARAVIGGFEADVVVLALAPDVERLRTAGLVTHDWTRAPHGGFFATTVVAFAVRPGNPLRIEGFADLARPGVDVLLPNPKTSGGAMWNGAALYGAALHGHAGVAANDPSAAEGYLRGVLRNVAILDKGARESMITFEKGVGDVAVTYESEIVAGRLAGRRYDTVIPAGTLVIDIPAAVVDVYADRHGMRDAAEAFVAFLHGSEAQRALAAYGFRAVDSAVQSEAAGALPPPREPFRIDALGGWQRVTADLFGKDGLFSRTWESVNAEDR